MSSHNCLEAANELVSGDRNADYGHPFHDFSKTAKIWGAILGIEVTPEQVALCMVGVKISREVNKHKLDNIVDGCGYFRTLEMIRQYRETETKEKSDEELIQTLHVGIHPAFRTGA